ncbi:MAG: NifB/NifX family molybdenum-iron cluster-binding protein, partial [Methanoregula sp.]|uniref:NifB/NifX family molybdenum-iron cluster-binding protein n=1 Tax=Methanoregula sp. TaxID=2052170 RepID=UPI003C31CB8C
FTVSDQKIGQNAVLLLSSHNVTTVITGRAGTQARNLLMNAHIQLHICESEGSVHEVLSEFLLTKKGKTGSPVPEQPAERRTR